MKRGHPRSSIDGKMYLITRFVYESLCGQIPEASTLNHVRGARSTPELEHLQRACINPDHQVVLSKRESNLLGNSPAARNSRAITCINGHPLTKRDRSGYRVCYQCHKARKAKWLAKRAAAGYRPTEALRAKARERARKYASRNREKIRSQHRNAYWKDVSASRLASRVRHSKPSVKAARAKSARKYQVKNKERILLLQRLRRQRDPGKDRAVALAWYHANREKALLAQKRWRQRHPEHQVIRHQRRRARKAGSLCGCQLIEPFIAFIHKHQPPCYWCGKPSQSHDHLLPISKGGKHEFDNVEPACMFCNVSKKDRSGPQYMDYLVRKGKVAMLDGSGKRTFLASQKS